MFKKKKKKKKKTDKEEVFAGWGVGKYIWEPLRHLEHIQDITNW